jgi:general secretion pathway protein H
MQLFIKRTGFTLIEILVVLFIISIVTAVVLLTIGHNQSKRIEQAGKQFTDLLAFAKEQALLEPAVIGIVVKHNQYFFVKMDFNDQSTSKWRRYDDPVLHDYSIPDKVQFKLVQEGALADNNHDNADDIKPQIIISMNGTVSPFKLYIGNKEHSPTIVIQNPLDGDIEQTFVQ